MSVVLCPGHLVLLFILLRPGEYIGDFRLGKFPRSRASVHHASSWWCRTAAGSAKKDASPKEYLSRLQTELPRDAYNSIVALLKAYRTSKDSNALIDGVVTVLRPKERRHLLPGFHIFIDKPNRPWFARCIRCAHQNGSLPAVFGASTAYTDMQWELHLWRLCLLGTCLIRGVDDMGGSDLLLLHDMWLLLVQQAAAG